MQVRTGKQASMTASREEWARSWALPFVAAIGISGATLFPYVSSLLLVPVTHSFGWTRAQFSLGLILQIPIGIIAGPLFGRLVDRLGPRRVLLAGIPSAACGLLLLGFVGPSIWQWWFMAALLGLMMAPILPIGWMAAVVARFDASRGLALAIALAGVGLGAAVWPVLGSLVIRTFGWRAAFPILGLGWGLVLFPLSWAILPREVPEHLFGTDKRLGKAPLSATLRSKTAVLLIGAGGLFILAMNGLNFNLVPILSGLGYSLAQAAGIAGLAGLAAIAGRILTGMVLDHVPTRPLAIGMFLLPLISIALLEQATAPHWKTLAAAGLLGFCLGAESDIIAFIASRRFERRVYASAYAIVSAIFSVCAAIGPFVASSIYDIHHSYRLFFLGSATAILSGAVLLAFLPDQKERINISP
jgi:MFS family permease